MIAFLCLFQVLPTLEKKIEDLRIKYERLKSVKHAKEKSMALKEELAWAFVYQSQKVRFSLYVCVLTGEVFVLTEISQYIHICHVSRENRP